MMKTKLFCGDTVSRLGFGCMRLPTRDNAIDYSAAEALIDRAIEAGITYFDTAYFYHNGTSETFLRDALIRRYDRSRFFLADKLPVGICKTPEQAEEIFKLQMDRLKTDYVDFHLQHGLNAQSWETSKRFGIPEFQRELKKQGKIRHIGFSFHDVPEVLPTILDENEWDFCQLQINYFDWWQSRAEEIYHMCTERGIPVIVMEPVRGGGLANPVSAVDVLRAANPNATPASWALRFAATLPDTAVVLSGMSNAEQLEDNIRTFSDLKPLSDGEQSTLRQAFDAMVGQHLIGCTACHYCDGCPQNIEIPRAIEIMNNFSIFRDARSFSWHYHEIPEGKRPDRCIACRECEEKCPQKLPISQIMHDIAEKSAELAAAKKA